MTATLQRPANRDQQQQGLIEVDKQVPRGSLESTGSGAAHLHVATSASRISQPVIIIIISTILILCTLGFAVSLIVLRNITGSPTTLPSSGGSFSPASSAAVEQLRTYMYLVLAASLLQAASAVCGYFSVLGSSPAGYRVFMYSTAVLFVARLVMVIVNRDLGWYSIMMVVVSGAALVPAWMYAPAVVALAVGAAKGGEC
ncbi:hypothetical protein BCR44DRAFT_70821 [Catenaria anguillulae PL171]|uniref:Uncharacterized protein n=1 Tax=Catenaria anguillulae PL171 TaxID=765915 RepID=A0A1Y2HPE4_9FUNG|nr:hypothetical protein BCR44DRAFT_70821 [Catenaria anguillulae PL171]